MGQTGRYAVAAWALAGLALGNCAGPSRAPREPAAADYLARFLGSPGLRVSRSYVTSFESVNDVAGFYIEPPGHHGTTFHELSGLEVHSGRLAHRAWIAGANAVIAGQDTTHRGYPTFQLYKRDAGPFRERVLVELWVWLDISLRAGANRDWFSFATFTSYAGDRWARVYTVNLDAEGHVYVMHVPGQTQAVRDIFQTQTRVFPAKTWVKLSVLIDYASENRYTSPFIAVWQDDELVSAARFDERLDPRTVAPSLWPPCLDRWDGSSLESAERLCGLDFRGGLAQAHFGMYAAPLVSSGFVYNDDLAIHEIRKP